MIELNADRLRFTFPEVHEDAVLDLDFQRTLRIPDDGRDYPLPPGLGSFPLRHVDDFARRLPAEWIRRGGVMLPMHAAEAMWISFRPQARPGRGSAYPFAVKIAAGKINAVTGEGWSNELHRNPQDYLALPRQPWLDGFVVEKGVIRQFTAMPLGEGYTAEEQLTAQAEHGGVQVVVYPMKAEVFERRFPVVERTYRRRVGGMLDLSEVQACPPSPDMGLGAGGRMKQEIYDDPFDFEDWDRGHASRCFVHLADAALWTALTGETPPTLPPSARDYSRAGLPWFDWYAEGATAVGASERLAKLRSIAELGREKGETPLPANESVEELDVRLLREGLRKDQVREGTF